MQIREIKKEDNVQIESVIRSAFLELNIPLEGTAYEDPETSKMFEAYNTDRSVYFVVEMDEEIAEFESDKATLEFPSPESGRLIIVAEEGRLLPGFRGRSHFLDQRDSWSRADCTAAVADGTEGEDAQIARSSA